MNGVPRVEIAPGYSVPRIINGAWQLSRGHATEPIERDAALAAFDTLVARGFTAFDCADIYTGVEELLGEFLRRLPAERRDAVQVHTKLVPDRDALATLDRTYVERIVDRSLRRLGVERLDLVQFHWWDYEVPRYLEAAGWLVDLQEAGKIGLLGATNFDVARFDALCDAGIPLVTHQVQYSPLDTRPERGMAACCARHDAWLLCYGGLAGGFLSDAWICMSAPPAQPANRSLVKYRLIIEEFGGWELYQDLLVALAAVARRHEVTIAQVALRWLLERPRVAAAIVGVGRSDRAADKVAVFSFALDGEDRAQIDAVLQRRAGPRGDVFDLERAPGGAHAAIMRTDLNRDA
jgi:aryl-alcohol dehydrogenase-like predicted oxidoreductase